MAAQEEGPEKIRVKVAIVGAPYGFKSCFLGRLNRNLRFIETVNRGVYVVDDEGWCFFWGYNPFGLNKYVDAAIVVYDQSQQTDFVGAKFCVNRLRREIASGAVITLVEYTAYLSDRRAVNYEEAKSYAKQNELLFFEVSATVGMNVDNLLAAIESTISADEIAVSKLWNLTKKDNKGKTVLNLARRQLFRVPKAVTQSSQLHALDLSYNSLVTLPWSTGNLTRLVILKLKHNKLTYLPHSIGDLVILDALDLSYNSLETLPSTIGKLKFLTILNVSHNKLRHLPRNTGDLAFLNVLDVSYNALGALPYTICELKKLTILKVSHNELTYLGLSIGDLVNLIQLFLNDNCLLSIPTTVQELQQLEEMDVRNNSLEEICTCIIDLKSLKTLWVESNPLPVEEMRNLVELTNRNPNLVIDIAVVAPAEIRAQGLGAELLYLKALRDGFVNVYRGRIFLIGQDRAGKTSLKKFLLGLPFDPKEESTDGIVVDPSKCEIDVDKVRNWHSTSENKSRVSTFSREISRALAEKRYYSVLSDVKGESEEKSDGELPTEHYTGSESDASFAYSETTEESNAKTELYAGFESEALLDESQTTEESNVENESVAMSVVFQQTGDYSAATENYIESGSGEELVDSQTTTEGTNEVDESSPKLEKQGFNSGLEEISKYSTPRTDTHSRDDDVRRNADELLKHMLLGRTGGDSNSEDSIVTVDVWDFAGQHLYYASHPVFLSSRAVYVLVHNLSKPLDGLAEPCVRQGTHDIRLENSNGETNLEDLLSWLVTVHRMKPKEDEILENTERKLSYLRPPVFIVGTHADKPFDEPNTTTSQIQQRISGKEYESHVIRPFFTIDNTQGRRITQSKVSLLSRVKQLFGKRQTEASFPIVRFGLSTFISYNRKLRERYNY